MRTRRRMLAGLVIVVPLAVTLFVASLVYGFVERLIGPFVGQIFKLPLWHGFFDTRSRPISAIEFVLTILIIFLLLYTLGFVSSAILFRQLYVKGEKLLLRVPLIRSIYGITKQSLDLVMSSDRKAFKQMVLVEFPRQGIYALGFATGQTRLAGDSRPYTTVFMPTTPNPTSGFLLILPEEDVRMIDLSLEEGFKMLMSGGVIAPEEIPFKQQYPIRDKPPGE